MPRDQAELPSARGKDYEWLQASGSVEILLDEN